MRNPNDGGPTHSQPLGQDLLDLTRHVGGLQPAVSVDRPAGRFVAAPVACCSQARPSPRRCSSSPGSDERRQPDRPRWSRCRSPRGLREQPPSRSTPRRRFCTPIGEHLLPTTVTLASPEDDDGQLRTGHGMRPPFDSSRRSRSRPRARNLTACVRRVVNRAPARPLKGAMGTSSPPTRGRPVSDKTDHGAILGGSRRGPDTLADRRSGDHENACRKRALPMQRCRRLPADTAPVRARIAANAIARPGWPRRSRSWQRHSEPGPAARVEAVVAPPGTNRPGCARSRQGTEFAESRFRASRVTFVRRQRPYRRSPRSRSSGCARLGRSGHLIAAAISAARFRPNGT